MYIVVRGGIPIAQADSMTVAQRYALQLEHLSLGYDPGRRLFTWRLDEKTRAYRLYLENLTTGRYNRTWWTVRRVFTVTEKDLIPKPPDPSRNIK